MRLYPPVTQEDALTFLKKQTAEVWGEDAVQELEGALKALAEAMAAVGAAELPEELEPLFP